MKRLQDKPFVMLGVNSDKDRDKTKRIIQDKELAWRSWWDGGSTGGPISTAWGVFAWPTIFVIDHRGVIRFKNVKGKALDAAIDKLVAEAQAAK